MHQATLQAIIDELKALLPGRFLGRIFQLSEFSLALDFGLKREGYLFISIEPAAPRLYLIRQAARVLEKESVSPTHFIQALRTNLGGGRLLALAQDADERVARFVFSVADELGDTRKLVLVAQLTGRSANMFLLDAGDRIIQTWRAPKGAGQQPGDLYQPPPPQRERVRGGNTASVSEAAQLTRENFATLSEAADEHYRKLELTREFDKLAGNVLAKLRKEIAKRQKLRDNLKQDLVGHGNPEAHKRRGDLLLANISQATRSGNKAYLTDYYSEGSPLLEIEVEENTSLADAASESFSRYSKAKRAIEELGTRLLRVDDELNELNEKLLKLEQAIAGRDPTALAEFAEREGPKPRKKQEKAALTLPGMRRYRSSDGYEVLVGRTARDNDQLTFRVARPNDLWLHAGDYPGSHVIVRNSSRAEIPHRTIIEAAQLAAKFSQASKDNKVEIHYTRRKFLSKPKGAAPGLVRLSSFKTIAVAPGENLERMK
jgi:predicted ribosome quality control (RQC) complex YloA/Tae2 family protein